MLVLDLPEREFYDERRSEFMKFPAQVVHLEHSLISLSKWEEKWHEPYLGRAGQKTRHTEEQTKSYIECMIITKNLPSNFVDSLRQEDFDKISEYINDSHTATTFAEDQNSDQKPHNRRTVTSELIYYWMLQSNIPFEAQKWNLNKLLTLIRVCDVMAQQAAKGQKKSKFGKSSLAARRALNAQRREMYGTSG